MQIAECLCQGRRLVDYCRAYGLQVSPVVPEENRMLLVTSTSPMTGSASACGGLAARNLSKLMSPSLKGTCSTESLSGALLSPQ